MATNFLWAPGTSNNGLLTSAFNLMTTEMNSLASNGTATSSVGGSSGLFTNSNTAQGILAELFLTLGAIGTAVVAGGGVAGQAGAVAHGIARALQKMNSELRPALKKAGHIRRDPREKERKKAGQPGARKRFQFSKR